MAVTQLRVVLSAYYPDGRPIDIEHFITGLGVSDVPYEIYGGGQDSSAGGLRITSLDLADFEEPIHRPEAHDDYERAIRDRLLAFATWLSRVPTANVLHLRSDGLKVWVIVNLWIDGDQMDFRLPPPLAAELGRLDLELYILSNE